MYIQHMHKESKLLYVPRDIDWSKPLNPYCEHFRLANSHANRRLRPMSYPRTPSAKIIPAMNVSPAPTVSTTMGITPALELNLVRLSR